MKLVLTRKVQARRRPTYVAGLRQYLTAFARGREGLDARSIRAPDIEAWFQARNEAPSTQAANLGRLSALFDCLWRQGYIEANPCRRVERVTVDRGVPKILTVAQVERLMAYSRGTRAYAYAVLSVFAGLRPEEARQQRWSNWIDGSWRIDAEVTKVRRRRIVHLTEAALAWLGDARERGAQLPLAMRQVRVWRREAAQLFGWRHWPQDVLRHSAASYMLADVRDAGKVAYELGNSPGILMRHYAELVDAAQARAYWSLRPPAVCQLELRL